MAKLPICWKPFNLLMQFVDRRRRGRVEAVEAVELDDEDEAVVPEEEVKEHETEVSAEEYSPRRVEHEDEVVPAKSPNRNPNPVKEEGSESSGEEEGLESESEESLGEEEEGLESESEESLGEEEEGLESEESLGEEEEGDSEAAEAEPNLVAEPVVVKYVLEIASHKQFEAKVSQGATIDYLMVRVDYPGNSKLADAISEWYPMPCVDIRGPLRYAPSMHFFEHNPPMKSCEYLLKSYNPEFLNIAEFLNEQRIQYHIIDATQIRLHRLGAGEMDIY